MQSKLCVCEGCGSCGGTASAACAYNISRKNKLAREASLCHWCGEERFGVGSITQSKPSAAPSSCGCAGCSACAAWRKDVCGTDLARRYGRARAAGLCHYCGEIAFGPMPEPDSVVLRRHCKVCDVFMNRRYCRQCGNETTTSSTRSNRCCPLCEALPTLGKETLADLHRHLVRYHAVTEEAARRLTAP